MIELGGRRQVTIGSGWHYQPIGSHEALLGEDLYKCCKPNDVDILPADTQLLKVRKGLQVK